MRDSLNLMHSSIGITDSIYAVLSDKDMQERIARLGQTAGAKPDDNKEKLVELLREVLTKLEASHAD